MGEFIYDGVKHVHLSAIAGYVENPHGAFKCSNFKNCPVGWIRYKPSIFETIPDTIRCPECGEWMLNHGLIIAWSKSNEKIRKSGSGTPERYRLAIEALVTFKKLYIAELLVEKKDQWTPPVVPSIDAIIDIAPIIFDTKTITALFEYVSTMNLKYYNTTSLKEKTGIMSPLNDFYNTLPLNTLIKQTELVKQLQKSIPQIMDPTWVFYIWSKFGLVHRTKEKNRVYLERKKFNLFFQRFFTSIFKR